MEGLKKATALLPLSPERKDDIFGWEMSLDVRDPFLAFSLVKMEGESILARRRAREVEGKRSDEELWTVWKYSVVEINFRRIGRVMKDCRLDREKLRLWNYWFGQKVEGMIFEGESKEDEWEEDKGEKLGRRHVELLGLSGGAGAEEGGRRRASWGKRPSLDDVWDLVEFRVSPSYPLLLHHADDVCNSWTQSSPSSSSKIPVSPSSVYSSRSIQTRTRSTSTTHTTAGIHTSRASFRPASTPNIGLRLELDFTRIL